MKNEKLFQSSIKKLVIAFMKGELNATICTACAVGNICNNNESWADIRDVNTFKEVTACSSYLEKQALKCIQKSGYSFEELMKIEKQFLIGVGMHNGIEINHIDFWHYNKLVDIGEADSINFTGLMAVVDVLQEIHECNADEVKEAKEMFVKVA
jgi:hypothetical protein